MSEYCQRNNGMNKKRVRKNGFREKKAHETQWVDESRGNGAHFSSSSLEIKGMKRSRGDEKTWKEKS